MKVSPVNGAFSFGGPRPRKAVALAHARLLETRTGGFFIGDTKMVKGIELTRGYSAIVDDADYEWLNQWKWHVMVDTRHNVATAARSVHGAEMVRNGKNRIYMHRFIMDCPTDMEIDHINGNTLDNRRSNLRIVTRSENLRNRRVFKNNKCGFKGVQLDTSGKWQVVIRYGAYETAKEAAAEFDRVITFIYGEFAKLNFP